MYLSEFPSPSWDCCRIALFTIFVPKYSYFIIGKFAKWSFGDTPIIGQYLDDFARLGVTISCMAYPSHYSCNDGAQDPNTIPYEIYRKTHEKARAYLAGFGLHATFIPWVQGFDFRNINECGGRRIAYASDPHHFRKQIKACNDLGIDSWFVWPSKLAFSRKDLYLPKAMLH